MTFLRNSFCVIPVDVTEKNQSAVAPLPLRTLFGNGSVRTVSKLFVNNHVNSLYVVVNSQGKHSTKVFCYSLGILSVLKLSYLERQRGGEGFGVGW